ncbi:hypothetical protein KKG31_02280 [Patescibacteria group bacterium]|nr:hypothetical protein [Patescibacteria group bacterium]
MDRLTETFEIYVIIGSTLCVLRTMSDIQFIMIGIVIGTGILTYKYAWNAYGYTLYDFMINISNIMKYCIDYVSTYTVIF